MSSVGAPPGFSSIGRPSISQAPAPVASSSNFQPSPAQSNLIRCEVPRFDWSPPADFANFPYRPHLGPGAESLREFLLSLNQGLIAVFLIIVTVAGGSKDAKFCLLAGIAGSICGGLAVGLVNFLSSKSDRQVLRLEFSLELEHFKYHRDVELEQLRNFLKNVNLSGNLLEAVVSEVGRNDESLMKLMSALDGIPVDKEIHPIVALVRTMKLFFIGSIPPVLPFFFVKSAGLGLLISCILVGVALFAVGAYKTKTTKGNPWVEGLENFILGAIAASLAYFVGYLFDSAHS